MDSFCLDEDLIPSLQSAQQPRDRSEQEIVPASEAEYDTNDELHFIATQISRKAKHMLDEDSLLGSAGEDTGQSPRKKAKHGAPFMPSPTKRMRLNIDGRHVSDSDDSHIPPSQWRPPQQGSLSTNQVDQEDDSSDNDGTMEMQAAGKDSEGSTLRFTCPRDFKKATFASERQPFIEDLQDKELWLIKLPSDVKRTDLQGVTFQKNDVKNIGTEDVQGATFVKEVHCWEDPSLQTEGLFVLAPSKHDRELHYAGHFKGQVELVRTLKSQPYVIPEATSPKRRKPLPAGLKIRYKPFGADDHVIFSSVKNPEIKDESQTDSALEQSFTKKKKKKKHRHPKK